MNLNLKFNGMRGIEARTLPKKTIKIQSIKRASTIESCMMVFCNFDDYVCWQTNLQIIIALNGHYNCFLTDQPNYISFISFNKSIHPKLNWTDVWAHFKLIGNAMQGYAMLMLGLLVNLT